MADTLTFQALQLANEQRNAYGLRYNDYARYRKHCANRTHRLRSTLKLTHGKGREFKKLPPVRLEGIKDGYLQLLLFEAERAWTYSQELSQLAAAPASKDKASAIRKNATSRFRKAVNWATQLLSHCQALHAAGRLPASNLIQATVYTLILNGRFLRYRYNFENALAQLCVARSLLDELASHASTSRDQALAITFADEISPEIRYCAHELGSAKAYDVDAIVAETASAHKNELVDGYDKLLVEVAQENAGGAAEDRKKLKPLLWEDEAVPIRNPELVDVLLKVQEAEEKLHTVSEGKPVEPLEDTGKKKSKVGRSHKSKQDVAAYDAILLALSDAEGVARKLVEAQQVSSGSSTAPAGTRDLQFVYAFVVYQLLARRIQRDLLLISTLLHQSQTSSHRSGEVSISKASASKQQVDSRLFPAVVKLLDTIIQSLTQMRALSIVDDSPDLATAVDARISFSKARRCQYLAKAYTASKKYAEAVALMQRATIHIRELQSALSLLPSPSEDPISTSELPFYALESNSISQLQEQVDAESSKCKKDWFSYNGGDASGTVDRSTYKKPLFFDIALNYAELNMDRLTERAGKKIAAPAPAIVAPVPQRAPSGPTETKSVASRAKVEEIQRPMTPEPSAAPTKGGLSSLLGGWWGRK
ncbi:uncharacterized protein PHACADRAFT_246467 [Phanerochaete carnosa HHB-10118-sp]|uniref:Signal recognition particle subunit SRP68 n=1 Tax=Phanerochaete carnosa (strain HHB-10118-sp) TaxID=650164 RepID=K5VC38_PHACS|nr:uncharacterized protein PHACADRAFT_246467 [Phanerochaete carnosa HHB-10118-sp]EKM60486.1 hypothetical protein PHACADRAFT_246467 [Phanerochaete carnosa HHB-10118-sp]